jgi:hypothetical protein
LAVPFLPLLAQPLSKPSRLQNQKSRQNKIQAKLFSTTRSHFDKIEKIGGSRLL